MGLDLQPDELTALLNLHLERHQHVQEKAGSQKDKVWCIRKLPKAATKLAWLSIGSLMIWFMSTRVYK